MEQLSQRARLARIKNRPSSKLAEAIYELSNPSKELVIELVELLKDYEDAEAFRNKADARRTGKNETMAPGVPTVAGFHLDVERQIAKENYKRKNNLHGIRKRMKQIQVTGAAQLINFDGRND